MPGSAPGARTSLGLEPGVAALLCYVPCCLGLGFSALAAIVEKESRFVRFHAFQGLLVNGAVLALLVALAVAQAGFALLGMSLLATITHLAYWAALVLTFALMVLLLVRASAGSQLELPVLGPLARRWSE